MGDGVVDDLLEHAPCGYLSTAPDGTIVSVNTTLLELTGFERHDLVGKRRFSDLLSPGGRIYHETHYAPMLQMQGVAREIALEIVRADGERLPVLVNSVLDRSDDGSPAVVRTAVFDATDRRSYERELLLAKQRAEDAEHRAQRLAETLQQTLIPPAPPSVPGLDVAASYRPAGDGREVGGDFYDVFEIGPGDWVAVAGDVRGKGVEAAVVTALARYTIRAAAVRHPGPTDVLAALNAVLLHDPTDRFCTAVVVRLRQHETGWTATLAVGGHPLPVLLPPGGPPRLVGRTGALLGVFGIAELHEVAVELGAGTSLVLYTDGVTEARAGGAFFGDERLLDSVARHAGTAAELSAGLLGDVLGFQSGNARDDVVIVAVRAP